MRFVVAAIALLLVPLAFALPPGAATHDTGWCALTQETIRLGVGNALAPVEALNGVTHFWLDYPSCSAGRFFVDHTTTGVFTEQHCRDGGLLVYAAPGEVAVDFIINWLPAGPGGCA